MIDASRRGFLQTTALIGAALSAGGARLLCAETPKHAQRTAGAGSYLPTLDSLNTHPVPDWFLDAKFGIFLHWGLFSVPGFARKGTLNEALKSDYDRAMVVSPYAEDYWNAIKDPTTPAAAFHRSHYGSMPYEGFREIFNNGLKQWDPAAWAAQFRDAGAKYVILTAKYGDGYCLWPTAIANPHQKNWRTQRDVVGELAKAVRAAGLRFGTYYSGGIDWTFNRTVVRSLSEYLGSTPGGDYPAYADRHVRELIQRYELDVIWNDINWPTDQSALCRLFADYYNRLPDGVVNDRWSTPAENAKLHTPEGRRAFDETVKKALQADPNAFEGFLPEEDPARHGDFVTPEWKQFPKIHPRKWELCRSIGTSWGYNRTETNEDYATADVLLTILAEVVSKNGNLLLNVGPRGEDAQIPPEQAARLRKIGDWMRLNGKAIHGTRPWTVAEVNTDKGTNVHITTKGQTVNLIVLGSPSGERITVKQLALTGTARLLADGSPVKLRPVGTDLELSFAKPLTGTFAPVISVSTA